MEIPPNRSDRNVIESSFSRTRSREGEREGELRDVIISVLERSAHLIAYVKSAWRVDSRAG